MHPYWQSYNTKRSTTHSGRVVLHTFLFSGFPPRSKNMYARLPDCSTSLVGVTVTTNDFLSVQGVPHPPVSDSHPHILTLVTLKGLRK